MHAIQTSGNCIRNVTADHFAGAAADEVADPRPYAEIIRQWSSLHPEFSFLPRKFKVAVTARRARPRRHPGARHRPAAEAPRRRRPGLRRLRRRRPGPHAHHRQADPRRAARGRPAELPGGDPARLQSAGPARQQVQGAHQDPGARDRRRRVPARGGGGVAAHPRGRAEAARGRDPPHRGLFRPARLRAPARQGVACARPSAASSAG